MTEVLEEGVFLGLLRRNVLLGRVVEVVDGQPQRILFGLAETRVGTVGPLVLR